MTSSLQKTKTKRFTIVRLVLLATAFVVLADGAIGFYIYADSSQWCRNHAYYKTPGRGRNSNSPYSQAEREAIELDCYIHGLQLQLEYTHLPLNKTLTQRRLDKAMINCDQVRQFRYGWGCAPSLDSTN